MTRLLRSLYGRVSMLYLVLSLVLCLLCAWVTVRHFGLFSNAVDQKLSRDLAKTVTSEMSAALAAGAYEQAVTDMAHHLTMLRPATELYVLDSTGQILAHSPADSMIARERVALGPVHRFLGEAPQLPIWGDYPCSPGEQKVFSAAPASLADGRSGYTYVILRGKASGPAASMLQDSYILRTLLVSLLLVLGFTGVVGLLLFGLLTKRFRTLTEAVRSFKAGDHTQRAVVGRDDEVGALARAFNEMADTIAAQMEALRKTDAARRDLVASLSHDFRTPLTSLRGHAEQLMHRSDLAADDRTRLRSIVHSADRLERLATHLHDLSRLDAQQAAPRFEVFSLAELAHDIAIKFQPEAEREGLTFHIDIDPEVPPVRADIGLIERLISNLVDNALRYTSPPGTVRLSVDAAAEGVQVEVADTGCGIPEEHLPLVTQRFFQGQRDDANARDGSGLGLSIAEEVAQLHDTTLAIESEVDRGTTIAFTLPAAE
ncbi:MAG: HAMP domain-containing protein [Bacteroidetes bacterium]|jgi:signal transduction histidine kinase|nr:HAMP domain-containing protein [Bacteroidota bacterium]